MMPSLTSLSRPYFTFRFQWWGTGMAVWTAYGFDPSLNLISTGVPVMVCNGCSSQVLNALEAKAERNQCLKRGILSSVGGKGRCSGLSGVGPRSGQLQ